MGKRLLLLICIGVQAQFGIAQTGGKSVYSFLRLPPSARISALGGNLVSASDNDLASAYNNPALLKASMHNQMILSASSLFAGARYGYVSYANYQKKFGTLSAGILFSDYGKFEYTDPYADTDGRHFYAADYSFNLSWSKALDSLFSLGVNVKTLYSVYEIYKSVGLAADIGMWYVSKDKNFTAGFVIKNAGRQVVSFMEDNYEDLPFDVQFGLSKKFAHVPFTFYLTADHLNRYDLTYYDGLGATSNLLEDEAAVSDSGFFDSVGEHADKLMRHVVLGGELRITKNFNLKMGYNYLRRKELGVSSKMGTIGFSWGFAFNTSKFGLSFGRATYHQAGATNNLTLNLNISSFKKKKTSVN